MATNGIFRFFSHKTMKPTQALTELLVSAKWVYAGYLNIW